MSRMIDRSTLRRLARAAAPAIALAAIQACGSDDGPMGPEPGLEPASIELQAGSPMFAIGAMQEIRAAVRDAAGAPVSGVSLTWTSSHPGVATVTGAGIVTATGHGSSVITVSAGGLSATTSVTVNARAAGLVRVTAVDQPDANPDNDVAPIQVTVTRRP